MTITSARRKPKIIVKIKLLHNDVFCFKLSKMIFFSFQTSCKTAKGNICSLCECDVNGNRWREHLMICNCNGRKLSCNICEELFKKSVYLIRHKKKFHEQNTEEVEAVEKSR